MQKKYRSLAQVMAGYNKMEDYIKAYVDHQAGNVKTRLHINSLRFYGCHILDRTNNSFPSYAHWRFNPNHKFNREIYL